MTAARTAWAAVLAAALLAGCGGGGGNHGECISGNPETCTATNQPAAPPPPLLSSGAYANVCTLEGQKQYTRAYLNDYYLWYTEIPAVDASLFNNVPDYFHSLLTPQLDATGQYKDRFSFIVTNADADSLSTGANVGYGVLWQQDSQGRKRVAFVDAGSPAAAAGLARGGELVSGASGANWYPNAPASISFVYRSSPVAATRTVSLSTAAVQEDPVPVSMAAPVAQAEPSVWYLLFNAHTEGAQDKLISAVTSAKAAGAQQLVLDLRYNRGGLLYAAHALASMVAGSNADGKVFEQLRFNDKRAEETAQATYRFSGQVQQGEQLYPAGAPLPRLDLPRVYVLATGETCSASESVINSLRGVGVDVVIVGQKTCGKPYGMIRADNCGYSYFAIEFQGVNELGFGDYANGFTPTCAANDDFDNALGSPSERLLATALYHIRNGSCPSQPMAARAVLPGSLMSAAPRPPLRGKLIPSRR